MKRDVHLLLPSGQSDAEADWLACSRVPLLEPVAKHSEEPLAVQQSEAYLGKLFFLCVVARTRLKVN